MTSTLNVGIDWGMDAFSVAQGQHRYASDLIAALARLDLEARFTVFGTRPAPPQRLTDVFTPGSKWEWVQKPAFTCRGSDWLNQWRSFWAHRGRRLDVIHIIDTAVPALAPCPVVATAYDLMYELFPVHYGVQTRGRAYRRWRWLHRHRVSRHVAISHTTAADVNRLWGIPFNRLDVVHPGVADFPPLGLIDDARPTLAVRLPGLSGRFVLSPYNLEPRKNLAGLLTAFESVREHFPDLKLVLFGKAAWSAERETALDRQITELGIGPAVVRTGFVDDLELAKLYRAADVFAFPSLYEGFGLPVLEAMACGGCVLARKASAMVEVLGTAGLALETACPQDLAAGLIRLLSDPAERDRLRVAAQERAAAFSTDRMAQETFASYLRTVRRG